jgi:hypothetical protein
VSGHSLFRFEGAACAVRDSSLRDRRPPPWEVGPPGVVGMSRTLLFENSIASTSIFVLQATKSQRWMPWRLKPKKDVGGCDKPRGAAYRASIRGCPNGETRHPYGVSLQPERIGLVEGTGGIETSKYPEERKATATP